MKFIPIVLMLLVALTCSPAGATDKTKALLAIENARGAIARLVQRGGDTKLVANDVTQAKNYLQRAETIYQDNVSWLLLGNLSDSAEPEIRNYAEMAELAASIGLSRLAKVSLDEDSLHIERNIMEASAKVKVFQDKAAEVLRLKAEAGKYDKAAQELSSLKGEKETLLAQVELLKSAQSAAEKAQQVNATLQKQVETLKTDIATLTGQLETARMEKASISGQLDAVKADKNVDELKIKNQNERIAALEAELVVLRHNKEEAAQSGKKLSEISRQESFKAELSRFGALTDITPSSFTLVIPRNEIIKSNTRGHQLSSDADRNLKGLFELISQYPEFRIELTVYGYGRPAKLENLKAAEQMAKLVYDYVSAKLDIKPDRLKATGGTQSSSLFPKNAMEAHKRIEFKFVLTGS